MKPIPPINPLPSSQDIQLIRAAMVGSNHRLFLDLCWYTLAPPGAVLNLKACDVFNPYSGEPRRWILFKVPGRSPGEVTERVIPLTNQAIATIATYQPGDFGWLFPSRTRKGFPLAHSTMDKAFRRAALKAGFQNAPWSLTSIRLAALQHLRHLAFDGLPVESLFQWGVQVDPGIHNSLGSLPKEIRPGRPTKTRCLSKWSQEARA